MKYSRMDEILIANQVAQADLSEKDRARRRAAASFTQNLTNQHNYQSPIERQQKMFLTSMGPKFKSKSNLNMARNGDRMKLSMLLLMLLLSVARLVPFTEASSFVPENSKLVMQRPLVNSNGANRADEG